MKNKNNTKTWAPLDIWTKHLTDLETTGICSHVFSQAFTLDQKVTYCNEMITRINKYEKQN